MKFLAFLIALAAAYLFTPQAASVSAEWMLGHVQGGYGRVSANTLLTIWWFLVFGLIAGLVWGVLKLVGSIGGLLVALRLIGRRWR